MAGHGTRLGAPRGLPDWVIEKGRVGFEAWRDGRWIPRAPGADPEAHATLLSFFLSRVRVPFQLERGTRLFFGRDDLALSSLRPRHGGLDIGARVALSEERRITILPPGARVQTLVPGGYLVGGLNLQKVLYLYRRGRERFRLILALGYDHVQFQGKARGSIRCFSLADQKEFLRWPCATSQAILRDGQIVGYEALGWVRHPGGVVGTLRPGRYQTLDPVLAARRIPKGPHLHLTVSGIHDDDLPRKIRFLNESLRARLETARDRP